MAIRNFAKYLALAVLAASCQVQELQNPQAPTKSEPAVSDVIPGKATVEFSEEMITVIEEGLQEGNGVMEELGVSSMIRVFPDAGEYEALHRRAGLHRFYRVTYSKDIPVTKAVQAFRPFPAWCP